MAYDTFLSDRVKRILINKSASFAEKKMFGGLCYMVDDKMCIGIHEDRIMARIGPEAFEEALTKTACKPMDFTGRVMKGFVFVYEEGIDTDEQLEYWVDLCLAFNPFAKSSKKKKK